MGSGSGCGVDPSLSALTLTEGAQHEAGQTSVQGSSIHTQLTFSAGMHYESKDTRAGKCHTQYKTCLESTYVPKSQDHTAPCRLQMVPTKAGSKPCPVGQAFLTVGSCPLYVPKKRPWYPFSYWVYALSLAAAPWL